MQAGRAGRDGRAAKCVLLYAPDDVTRIAGMAVDDVEKCDVVGTQPQPQHLSGALVSRTMPQSVSRPKVLGMIKVWLHPSLSFAPSSRAFKCMA